jgi:hypothetical protein
VILIVPPANLLLDCKVDKPPAVEKYSLLKGWIGQTGNLTNCNKDKTSLRIWVQKQKDIYHVD